MSRNGVSAGPSDEIIVQEWPVRSLPFLSTYEDLERDFHWSRTRVKALVRDGHLEAIREPGRTFILTESALRYVERLRAQARTKHTA
jgi:hypothetical protein